MNTVFVKGIKYGVQFAKVLIGLPLKIVGALATKFGNAIRSDVIEVIGSAVESTKDFIDAGSRAGRGLKGLADEGAKDMGRLMNVRSDMVKLFGTGAGAIAAMIGEISDGIKNMGPLADTVGATIAKNEQSALYFVKATRSMGLAADEVQYLTAEAVKNGESLYDSLDRVMLSINRTAKSSGLDQKRMSRNFFHISNVITNLWNEFRCVTVIKSREA
jgi:methyl-accepting chemotaxis protein